jgi:glycosyltransferase involved in cell wall biosynthesis
MKSLKGKNILYVVNSYNNFQKDQIDTMAKYFNNVYVLTRYDALAKVANIIPLSIIKPLTLEHIIQLDDTPDNVKVYPIPLYYLPFPHDTPKGLNKQMPKKALKIIDDKGIKFDLVHAHFNFPAGAVGKKLKELNNIPFILTSHGFDIYRLPYIDKGYKRIITGVIKSADVKITVSKSNLKHFEYMGIDINDVLVRDNGYNSHMFYPKDKIEARKKLGLPLDKRIILNIGYLRKVKGQKYLIDAMKQITKDYPDVVCYIIGDGALKSKLQKQINGLSLENKVILTGGKSHKEIPDWMNAIDLFAFPSLSESFGVVQLEALACGKPVVATRNGGSEYVIKNDEVGFLCEKGDADWFADIIKKALKRNWDYNVIIKYAQKYSWENICKNIASIYEDLLNK